MHVLSAELEAEVAARRANIQALRVEARRIENEPSGPIQHITIPAPWVPVLLDALEDAVEFAGEDADPQVVNEMGLLAQAIRDGPADGSSSLRVEASHFEAGFCGLNAIWADLEDGRLRLDYHDCPSLTKFVLTEELEVLTELLMVFGERLPQMTCGMS